MILRQRSLWFASLANGVAAAMVATPASAASVDDLVRTAVFELCPDLMAIDTPLAEEDTIKALKPTEIGQRKHMRFGDIDFVSIEADDGKIWIANSRTTSFCQVGITSGGSESVLKDMANEAANIDATLALDDADTVEKQGYDTQTYRTPTIDGLFLGVQFVNVKQGPVGPMKVIQQYLIEES